MTIPEIKIMDYTPTAKCDWSEEDVIRYRLSMAMESLYEIKNLSSTSAGAKRAKTIATETVNAILEYKG